jgi:hypothetical protein
MATTKDKLLLQEIDRNEKISVRLGEREIKIRRLTNAVAERFDKYTAEAEMSYKDGELLLNMGKNRKLIPKSVSLIILGSWLKVTLFHWIYWRWLHIHYDQSELGTVLREGISMGECNALCLNLLYLQDNNRIIQRATTGTIRNTMEEQKSGVGTQSSSNSTEQ